MLDREAAIRRIAEMTGRGVEGTRAWVLTEVTDGFIFSGDAEQLFMARDSGATLTFAAETPLADVGSGRVGGQAVDWGGQAGSRLGASHYTLAIAIAQLVHRGQYDKAGQRYMTHIIGVVTHVQAMGGALTADLLRPAEIVAVLHDTVEDSWVTADLLRPWFGDLVTDAVEAISRRPKETYPEYTERVALNPLAVRVKLADLADNLDEGRLGLLEAKTRERLERKYRAAQETLQGVAARFGA
jgi:hypothetical protein